MIRKFKNNLVKRKTRIRAKIRIVSSDLPRLSVFRSGKHIYAQIIDVKKNGKVLAASSDLGLKGKFTKTQKAEIVGEKISEMMKKLKIQKIAFDRSGYAYNGRLKSLAQKAREGGLKF